MTVQRRSGADASTTVFRRLGWLTVAAVYFLILVGGIVRASGAGMGCPDWPRCFGTWIPPTSEAQLPADYQEIYADHGYGSDRFNVVKTWTEYINRLIGVIIGVLIFATLVASLRYRRDRPGIVWLCLAAFLLVGFQGWLGSVVVSSNLTPWIVTVHMLLALVIVALLIDAVVRSRPPIALEGSGAATPRVAWALTAALLLSIVQIVLGTQVREQVDELALQGLQRSAWIAELGSLVLVHRSLSIAVVIANVYVWLQLRRRLSALTAAARWAAILVALVVLEAAVGALLYYFSVPALLQPLHLLFAALMAGIQCGLIVLYRRRSRPEPARDELGVRGLEVEPLA